MKLNTFIKKYICPNTLIRLWVPDSGGGHRMIYRFDERKPGNIDDVCMEHELLSSKSWLSQYSSCEVIGVTDILMVDSFYSEAVNIVIKPKIEGNKEKKIEKVVTKGEFKTKKEEV